MSDATYERSAINIDLVESMAKEKAGMLYPRGGGNPALGVTAVQLGMTAGVLTAGAGIAAVAATASSDRKNGTESSLGDYISNAFSASARVGASCIAITLGMYGAEVMTLTVSGGMGLIPVGGTVVTLPQLAGAFLEFFPGFFIYGIQGVGQVLDLQAAGVDLKIYGDPQVPSGPCDIEENRGEAILLQDRSAEGLDLIYKFLIRREQEYIPDGAPQNLDAFWKHEYHNKDGHDLVKIWGDKS